MKFDRSNKFALCYYGQVNSLRLKSSVASKWASKQIRGYQLFCWRWCLCQVCPHWAGNWLGCPFYLGVPIILLAMVFCQVCPHWAGNWLGCPFYLGVPIILLAMVFCQVCPHWAGNWLGCPFYLGVPIILLAMVFCQVCPHWAGN